MAVKTYRKTALVTAEQFLPAIGQIPKGVYSSGLGHPSKRPDCQWSLKTKEGVHVLRVGDYICTGPAGEQWNVEQEIFEATYKEVMTAEPSHMSQADAFIKGALGKGYHQNVEDLAAMLASAPTPPADAQAARIAELEGILHRLVDLYVKNKGANFEFIACITPKHASEMTPEERAADRVWSAWDAAMKGTADV